MTADERLALVLDNQGTLRFYFNPKQGPRGVFTFQVAIHSNDYEKVAAIQEDAQAGTLKKVTHNGREYYRWMMASAESIREVFPRIIPHMTRRRRQAELVLEAAMMVGARGRPSGIARVKSDEEAAIVERMAGQIKEVKGIRDAEMIKASE